MRVWLMRILVLLLAFRAIIAPLTFRPTKADSSHHSSLVMRVRWWPPQRLQRFSATSKLLQLFRGKNAIVCDGEGRPRGLLARWPSPQHPLGAPVASVSRPLPAVPLTTILRC